MNFREWNGMRYHALNFELKRRFGSHVRKLPLNIGCTCPNRDGTKGYGGCIFCSEGGSGEFAASAELSVTEQIVSQTASCAASANVSGMFTPQKYVAYFQAFTNTYAPPEYLERVFTEAASIPDICLLSVATRPDCLPDPVIDVLSRINRLKPVWVELGLQTIHEETARLIHRAYPLSCFDDAVYRLRKAGLEVIVHTILGLPGETDEMILETMQYLAKTDIQGIKLQLLHILRNTGLEQLYRISPFRILSQEEYIRLVIRCLEVLPPGLVIHRLTGDGPRDLLVEPRWSLRKRDVLNGIQHQMKLWDTWQGKNCAAGISPQSGRGLSHHSQTRHLPDRTECRPANGSFNCICRGDHKPDKEQTKNFVHEYDKGTFMA